MTTATGTITLTCDCTICNGFTWEAPAGLLVQFPRLRDNIKQSRTIRHNLACIERTLKPRLRNGAHLIPDNALRF